MSRVTVHLWSGLRRFTDDREAVEVEARTVAEMLQSLAEAHPGLAPVLEAGVSVVIDGDMATGQHSPVTAENEIYLMQKLKGG